uniref:Uncharacterized protein n=1 Tax=Arundo donax TaxID=35708 RepID=A0A0A8ZTE7_ARUDO
MGKNNCTTTMLSHRSALLGLAVTLLDSSWHL